MQDHQKSAILPCGNEFSIVFCPISVQNYPLIYINMLIYVCQRVYGNSINHLYHYIPVIIILAAQNITKTRKNRKFASRKRCFFVTKNGKFSKKRDFHNCFAQIVLESTTDHLKTLLNNKNITQHTTNR